MTDYNDLARRALERATPPTESETRAFFERFPQYDTHEPVICLMPGEGVQTDDDRLMLERIKPDALIIQFTYPDKPGHRRENHEQR